MYVSENVSLKCLLDIESIEKTMCFNANSLSIMPFDSASVDMI